MKLGCNHPTGPLAALEAFRRQCAEPKYPPAPLLKAMVDAGHPGRKSGQGFHAYPLTKRSPSKEMKR